MLLHWQLYAGRLQLELVRKYIAHKAYIIPIGR